MDLARLFPRRVHRLRGGSILEMSAEVLFRRSRVTLNRRSVLWVATTVKAENGFDAERS
jgi:hypothetical protein